MSRKPSLGLEDLLHSIVQSVTDVQYDRPQHQKLADGSPASIWKKCSRISRVVGMDSMVGLREVEVEVLGWEPVSRRAGNRGDGSDC